MAGATSHGRNPDDAQVATTKSEHVGLDAFAQLFCPWRSKGKYNKGQAKKITWWQIFNLLRRLAIFAAALIYIARSIDASVASIQILRAEPNPRIEAGTYFSPLIPVWAGKATIRQSPLIMTALNGSTAPRNETIYLQSESAVSFTGCPSVPLFNPYMYSNAYLRGLAQVLVGYTTYNISFMAAVDMIAPVVDCGFSGHALGLQTILRVHYLVRHKIVTDNVYLMTFSMSMQDYSIPKQNQRGPAGVATLEFFNDMRDTAINHHYIVAQNYPYSALKFQVYRMLGVTEDHEWRLESIPMIVVAETPKIVVTASRTGFYLNVETEQSNIKNTYTATDDTASLVLSRWRWVGGPVLRDSWGWVHCIHIFFAADTMFSIFVLFMVIYRNLSKGKIWVGDAFVSVSNSLMYRGALIVITWIINDGWTLMEFCYQNANDVSSDIPFFSKPEIIHAGLLTLFLSVSSIVGYILRERIDPAVVVFAFEIFFASRVSIGKSFPSSKSVMTRFALEDLARNTLSMSEIVALTTPVRLWTAHELSTKSFHFIFVSILPTFTALLLVIIYGILRKIYRHYFPEKLHILKVSDSSEKSDALQGLKRNLTLFEVATGAALQRRVGVVSDYENCIYIKGMKYASADGIYCNGYVIANGKFLIATTDLLPIFVMKIIRLRFKNVYVYEVDGSTVQQTARLVYPETIAWHDLLRLNISVLS